MTIQPNLIALSGSPSMIRQGGPRFGEALFDASRNVSPDVLLLSGKRIQIDELQTVGKGPAVESLAAVKVNQGLHTPGIQIIGMLMPQCQWQQDFWQFNQRERWSSAHFAVLAPKQRIEGVNQLSIDLPNWQLVQFGRRADGDICVARARAHRGGSELPADQVRSRDNLPTHRVHAGREPRRLRH